MLRSNEAPVIARGAGLSYCLASALEGGHSIQSDRFNRILAFDRDCGLITVEPGVTLIELIDVCVPAGWIPAVLPGHPRITVGGCIGFNVHGKSQYHAGNFAATVQELSVFHPDHGEVCCSRERDADLFLLTVGGFGLTGYVTRVALKLSRLQGGAIRLKRVPVANLIAAVECMEREAGRSDCVYSWNDLNRRGRSFGAGYVYLEQACDCPVRGSFRPRRLSPERRIFGGLNFYNRLTGRLESRLYGLKEHFSSGESVLGLRTATFPINGKEIYFTLFGRTGLREYQMLVSRDRWEEVAAQVERLLRGHGISATLGSLKLFRGNRRGLEFGGDGICLAIDCPANAASVGFFEALDRLVISVDGIANLSKDSRLREEVVRRMYPGYSDFSARLGRFDPRRRFDSSLRRRIGV